MAQIAMTRIDSREPDWIKRLTFNGTALPAEMLPNCDLEIWTDDGHVISIERKTPGDLLGTLSSERLFPQMDRLVEERINDQYNGRPVTHWPYLMITGELGCSADGHVITDRGETGWSWASVQGALLTVQEMGIFVTYCKNDADYEAACMRLVNRPRGELKILPARPAIALGAQAGFLCSLPGIGVESFAPIMEWAGGNLATALVGLTDDQIPGPVSATKRKKIIGFLGGSLMLINTEEKIGEKIGALEQ